MKIKTKIKLEKEKGMDQVRSPFQFGLKQNREMAILIIKQQREREKTNINVIDNWWCCR